MTTTAVPYYTVIKLDLEIGYEEENKVEYWKIFFTPDVAIL